MSLLSNINGWLEPRVEAFDERTPWWITPAIASEGFQLPLGISLRSKRGLGIIDWLASIKFWRRSEDVGIGLLSLFGLLGLVSVVWFVTTSANLSEPTKMHDPGNWLVIPGINEFIPVAATAFVLLSICVGMFVHELGHAVAARAHDFPVEEWGVMLLFGFIPFGAYVKSDYDAVKEGTVRERLRFFSAGILNNTLVGIPAFIAFASITDPAVFEGVSAMGSTQAMLTITARMSVLQNALMWIALMNINLAVFNAIPISILDGGHFLHAVVERVASWFGRPDPGRWGDRLLKGTTYVTVSGVVLAMVIPHV